MLNFFLPNYGNLKNIHLSLIDPVQNTTYTFRTQLQISEDDWDKEKQRPINIYLKRFKKINNLLDKIKLQVTEHVQEKLATKKNIQQRVLSKEIKLICKEKITKIPDNSLMLLMENYIFLKKESICHSTYKRYQVFFKLLERFEGFTCKRLYINQVNADFMRDFMIFGKDEKYSESTIYRTICFVKTILNFAEIKGFRTNVRELKIRRGKQSREMVTLNDKEIKKIKSTRVSKDLKDAKNWLLISCFVGQRFSDFMNFSSDQLIKIGDKSCIKFTQQKTKKEIILPLHPIVLDILRRNKNQFPKQMDIQQYNISIKKIAKIAHIDETIKARKRLGFRSKTMLVNKWEMLSSHIGRRSFATNFYGKIPTPLLIEATGHSSEHMFLKYINPSNYERIISLSSYFEKL